jgi:MarR family transcriptional regulator, transcriptional regulator for hemolysin
MGRPTRTPIGLELTRTARTVSRAFNEALEAAGGSLPTWLILLSLKTRSLGNQRELAEAIGIQQATLTHHLNAMSTAGLLTRDRDPGNRRVHIVTLTDTGDAMFFRLRDAAIAFDKRLRHGISDAQISAVGAVLSHLAINVADTGERPASHASGPRAAAQSGTADA